MRALYPKDPAGGGLGATTSYPAYAGLSTGAALGEFGNQAGRPLRRKAPILICGILCVGLLHFGRQKALGYCGECIYCGLE